MDKPAAARMNYLSAAKRPPGSRPSHSPAAAKAAPTEEDVDLEGHSGADPAPIPALHEAAACGMAEEVLQLVAEGANVRARVDSTGDTAMHVRRGRTASAARGRARRRRRRRRRRLVRYWRPC